MAPFLIIFALLMVFVVILLLVADAQPKPHLHIFLKQQKMVRQQLHDKFTRFFS